MKKYNTLAVLPLLLFACGSPSSNPEKIDDQAVDQETTACYRYVSNQDTITFQLSTVGDKLSGELVYDWNEKDGNRGTVSGEAKGDTLVMDYIFMAEGMESVREEVFLKKGDAVYIGYGEAEEKGAKWVYKNRAQLKFDALELKKVPCK